MLLYLLFPAFILGVVGLPADNTTDGVHEEIIQLDGTLELLGNRTFNISLKDGNQLTELEGQLEPQTNQTLNINTEGDGAIKSNDETSSFYKDQVELEEKWVLPANQTLNSTTEDEGSIKSSGDPSTTTNYQDELSELEEKLGLPTNHTMNITTEDDERFQDQEQYHHPTHCNEQMLVEYSHMICGDKFHQSMLSYSKQHWCDLKYIIGKVMRKNEKGGGDDGNDDDDGVAERLGPYNKMTYCMEQLSDMLGCYYPNPSVQDFFLYIHSQYFYNCSEEELLLSDAPHSVVVVLTLLPVSLIPILVFLVIWKSKVVEAEACGDASVEACQGFMRHSRRFFQRCLERENIACDVDEALWPDRNRRCDS